VVNALADEVLHGTFAELLVQIKLLQFGIQSVMPLKDSGNDLLTTIERHFRAVQVKLTARNPVVLEAKVKRRDWDVIAIVHIGEADVRDWNDVQVSLDSCGVYLLERSQVVTDAGPKMTWHLHELEGFAMSRDRVRECFYPAGGVVSPPEIIM